MADLTSDIVEFDHALHAYVVEAEQRYIREGRYGPFDAFLPHIVEAFLAGQRAPQTGLPVTVQRSRFTDTQGAEHIEYEVASRAEVLRAAMEAADEGRDRDSEPRHAV